MIPLFPRVLGVDFMNRLLTKATGIALVTLASAMFANGAFPIAAQAATAAPAPLWTVNMSASRLNFQSSMGGEQFSGGFQRWNAQIRFDPKKLAASSVSVKVDMMSARTGGSERDEALPGDDWFASSKFAQATFAAKTFKDLGGGRYQAIGTLTMRGVTRPLTLAFQLKIQGNQAQMIGSTVIDRHVFGVGQGQFATADSVPFAVNVRVSLSAKRS